MPQTTVYSPGTVFVSKSDPKTRAHVRGYVACRDGLYGAFPGEPGIPGDQKGFVFVVTEENLLEFWTPTNLTV